MTRSVSSLVERLETETTVGLAVKADFYPENTPRGFIEVTLAVPEGCAFGSGLFELRFLRTLTPEERASEKSSYAAILRARPTSGGGA